VSGLSNVRSDESRQFSARMSDQARHLLLGIAFISTLEEVGVVLLGGSGRRSQCRDSGPFEQAGS